MTLIQERIRIGVAGYSAQKFDDVYARTLINEVYDLVERTYQDKEIVVISGLTNIGIPKIAYEQAEERGWQTVGVACEKAKEYDCFPVTEENLIGKEWGEESTAFIESIDVLIRIGGGKQSFEEAAICKLLGKPTIEYELESC